MHAACPTGCPVSEPSPAPHQDPPTQASAWTNQTTQMYPSTLRNFIPVRRRWPGQSQPLQHHRLIAHLPHSLLENWTLGYSACILQQAFLDMSYVGNHGVKRLVIRDLNQAHAGGAPSAIAAQYPYLGFINFVSNSLRIHIQRVARPLSPLAIIMPEFVAGYTYSHPWTICPRTGMSSFPRTVTIRRGTFQQRLDIRHRLLLCDLPLPGEEDQEPMLENWQVQ